MLDRIVGVVRIVALAVMIVGITAWCAVDLERGLTVLLMVITVPPLTLLVKTLVEGALVLIDDRLHEGDSR